MRPDSLVQESPSRWRPKKDFSYDEHGRVPPEARALVHDMKVKPPLSKMASLDEIDETPDERLTAPLPEVVSPYATRFQRGPFEKAAKRSFALLSKLSKVRVAQNRAPFVPESMAKTAHLIGEFYAWKHTPRLERDDDWPKSKAAFCEGYGITVSQLDHALSLVRFPRWEARYLEYSDPAVRTAMIKDVLLAGAVRQLDADPGKENANWMRTALQADGEIKGTQKITQVNVGSNVLNMPSNLTEEDLQARLARVNRLAESLKPREVPHEEVPE